MIPVPNHQEAQAQFIDRCMVDPAMIEDFASESERRAVCKRQWKRSPNAVPENKPGSPDGGSVPGTPAPPDSIAVKARACYLGDLADSAAPTRVLVFRDGANDARWKDGERLTCTIDAASARAIIDNFAALRRDQVFDYEHQTEDTRLHPDGKAPAAGWITAYQYVPGEGLYASVNWTADAAAEIKSRKYRYFSPVFYVDDDSRVIEVTSVALTNSPALIGLKPIAAKRAGMAQGDIAMKSVLKLLGLPDNATEDQALAAVNALKAAPTADAVAADVAKECGITATTRAALVASVNGMKAIDPTKWVARADFDTINGRVQALEAEGKTRERERFLNDGQAAGKITASNRELWQTQWTTDAKRASEMLATAPVIVTPGQLTDPGNSPPAANREAVIAKASAEYDADKSVNRVVSKRSFWVNGALQDAKFRPLTADEAAKID